MSDPIARMRRSNPVPSTDPPPLEPLLARVRDEPPPPARRGWLRRLSRPAAIALVALPLGAAAAAVAASGLLSGAPIEPPPGATFSPSTGLGVPVASSVELLRLRAADPAGGPPWGMRVLSTTRGLGCVQVGRVVGGRLGVLGRDGAFADDGRFHELPARVLDRMSCTLLDGAGRAYLAVVHGGLPASALNGGCRVQPTPAAALARMPASVRRSHDLIAPCAPGSVRVVLYGLLGPHATSVTYRRRDGRRVRVPVQSPHGAYLIVQLPPAGRSTAATSTTMVGPGSALESVRYRDGHVCRVRSPRALGGAKPCPPDGYVPPRSARVTTAQVASPVRARVGPAGSGLLAGSRALAIAFRARVAVRSEHAEYQATVTMPRGTRCRGSRAGSTLSRNVRAGQLARITIHVPRGCPGIARGRVVFVRRAPRPGPAPIVDPVGRRAPIVGTFTVRLPR